jgi:hypothetical protein
MNKRIQELMLLAGTDTSGKWMGVEHAERFAELIIQECIDYCGENLSKTVGGALKIHFGVEE